jgi:hypothetical protein
MGDPTSALEGYEAVVASNGEVTSFMVQSIEGGARFHIVAGPASDRMDSDFGGTTAQLLAPRIFVVEAQRRDRRMAHDRRCRRPAN